MIDLHVHKIILGSLHHLGDRLAAQVFQAGLSKVTGGIEEAAVVIVIIVVQDYSCTLIHKC